LLGWFDCAYCSANLEGTNESMIGLDKLARLGGLVYAGKAEGMVKLVV
jgi:hypothetical protein